MELVHANGLQLFYSHLKPSSLIAPGLQFAMQEPCDFQMLEQLYFIKDNFIQ